MKIHNFKKYIIKQDGNVFQIMDYKKPYNQRKLYELQNKNNIEKALKSTIFSKNNNEYIYTNF
jgi:hypothetical protein